MAYDEGVAQRLRDHFAGRDDIVKKKMFGGVALMHRGHMCVGVNEDRLMARVGAANYADALARCHARDMEFTGHPLKGFVYVDPDGFSEDNDLRDWVEMCEKFTGALLTK